ncbi:MAG: heme d1 biosynthesis radical SAM protein NirJ [Gammaproteobacteria bacterium]|nr:heme d1 biosynthesis radical SAM protein NirJ [Gammaproteobacteria bacterium]
MFRVTRFMQLLTGSAAVRRPVDIGHGPVVIWNLIRRCNLICKHCYSNSADKDFRGELNGEEVRAVMDDLYAYGVRVLILSGGEPLLRDDIFALARYAKAKGFYVGLSSNGTLIDEARADAIAEIGFDYVGVSIDGTRDTHDRFRRMQGAYDAALASLRRCRDRGIKVGMRFTATGDNIHELPQMLQLLDDEGLGKFYYSHLNYAGRGNKNRGEAAHRGTRAAMALLFDACLEHLRHGEAKEFVTGNNDTDGVFLWRWALERFPERAAELRQRLELWGGNSSGVNIANIDNQGNVHPDTMWWHHNLGNVRERPFSTIWSDTSDPLMAGLKARPRPLSGRCAVCDHRRICNGNTRVRAYQTTGDYWAEDPGCYLTDAEIGLSRPAVTTEAVHV